MRCCRRHGSRHDAFGRGGHRTWSQSAVRRPAPVATAHGRGCHGRARRFQDRRDLARQGRGHLGERAMVAVLIARCGHTRWDLVFLVVRVSVVHVHTLVLFALAAAWHAVSVVVWAMRVAQ